MHGGESRGAFLAEMSARSTLLLLHIFQIKTFSSQFVAVHLTRVQGEAPDIRTIFRS